MREDAEKLLYDKLIGNAFSGSPPIFNTFATAGTSSPYIVFMYVSEAPEDTTSKLATEYIFDVKVVSHQQDPTDAVQISDEIYHLLHHTNLGVSGGWRATQCRRIAGIGYSEPDGAAHHRGHTFRIRMQET